jgi:hypothetical protein
MLRQSCLGLLGLTPPLTQTASAAQLQADKVAGLEKDFQKRQAELRKELADHSKQRGGELREFAASPLLLRTADAPRAAELRAAIEGMLSAI